MRLAYFILEVHGEGVCLAYFIGGTYGLNVSRISMSPIAFSLEVTLGGQKIDWPVKAIYWCAHLSQSNKKFVLHFGSTKQEHITI